MSRDEVFDLELDGSEDLKNILKGNYAEAVRNLVTGKTPKDVIFDREGRGKKKYIYVPGWWFIQQANALFNYDWDFEVLQHGIEWKTHLWVKGVVTVRTRIKLPDGTYEAKTIKKSQFGSAEVKMKVDGTGPVDVGDDMKAAATDCLKKCLTQFGFASDVYSMSEALGQEIRGAAQETKNLDALYDWGSKAGLSREEVDEWSKEKTGKIPVDHDALGVLDLVSKLRKRAQEVGGSNKNA